MDVLPAEIQANSPASEIVTQHKWGGQLDLLLGRFRYWQETITRSRH